MERKRIELEDGIDYISYNYIIYLKNLAFYYLNTGLHSNVYSARNLISKAINTFEMGNFSSSEQFSTYFQLKLLMSLSYEFFEDHNMAYLGYENNLKEIEMNYPFVDEITKNLFFRLMYIINPDSNLKTAMENYSGEYTITVYQNKRRILEKDIYSGKATDFQIFELNSIFNNIKCIIDKVYHVTHYRLMYIYFVRNGDPETADRFFQAAINMAFEYQFHGQMDRLSFLRSIMEK